jgi:hypothetical protein
VSWTLRAKRLRMPLGFLFGGLYLAFARPTPGSLLLGAPVAFVGVVVRAWAAGHLVKNARLTTGGPYAHTRNPLYLGSFLIAAGFALAAHWSLLLVVIALFVFIYLPTIEREQVNIRSRFPDAYATYETNVPAFVPRLTPWQTASAGPGGDSFSFGLYMRHGEWKAALVYALAVGWLVFRTRAGL